MSCAEAIATDVPALAEGLKALAAEMGHRYSDERAREFIRYVMTSKAGKALVAPGGGLLAVETANIWAEKKSTQIFAVWAETPEQYDELVAACIKWFDHRKGSLMLYYIFPKVTEADAALARAGFDNSGSMIVRRKYGLL